MTNPGKSLVKIAVAEDFGRKIEDMAEKSKAKIHSHEGAKDAFKLGASRIAGLGEHVDKELKEGILEEECKGGPAQIATYVKKYLKRAVGALDNLATAAEIARHNAAGEEKALIAANKVINKEWQDEREKLEKLRLALEDGPSDEDDSDIRNAPLLDGHPGPTLKSQRKEESTEPAPASALAREASKPKTDKKASAKKKAPAKKKASPKKKK